MSINRSFNWLAILGMFGVQDAAVAQSVDIPHHPPPISQANVKPQSMIVMSNDHQLFYKAYTDFSDLDGDGEIDDTYKDSIRYYGYFDSEGCYRYNSLLAGGAFTRAKDASDDFECNSDEDEDEDEDGDDGGGNYWSGNFLNWAAMTRMDVLRKVLYGGKRFRDNATESTILERAFLPLDAHSFAKVIEDDDVIEDNTPFDEGEITICNTTYSASGSPPLIRVAKGRWSKWSANERWQCVWRNEKTGVAQEYREARPREGDEGLGRKNYHARVEVCVKDNDMACESYPDSAYEKPIGLLHAYADSIDFGLISGSYAKNKSGGVLRSNVRSFMEEFDPATGIFDANVPDEPGVPPDHNGIVSNIDAFRVSGYSYANGTYAGDSCGFGTKAEDFGNGQCSSWGNPFAEMTLEAIRYLTGEESASGAFKVGSGVVETGYLSGLTSPTWEGNEVAGNWCAAHSMVLINASEASFDANELSGLSFNVKSQTDDVGNAEELSGDYFVGEAGANKNKQCTAKSIGGLGGVLGICPTAPGLEGSYNVAGLAKYAYENQIVKNPADDNQGGNISTYAVRLSSNIPEIKVKKPGKGDSQVGIATIVPACESYSTGDAISGSGKSADPARIGKCAIVDFRVSGNNNNAGRGSFDVIWEDSEFGGDYDSDLVMTLDYEVNGNSLKITTDVNNQSTSQIMGVGYIVSGTGDDGFHAHSGINGYDRFECGLKNKGRGGEEEGGEECNANDSEVTLEYKFANGSSGDFLRPPLYYAAEYGNDGVNEDGSPAAYFEVNRIGELVESLEEVLDQVLRSSARSGAGIGFSSSSGGVIFQTIYNNTNSWSGDLLAFGITDEGVSSAPIWSAREQVPLPDDRTVVTWLGGDGASLPTPEDLQPYVDYIRGDPSNEQRNGGPFRDRTWLDGTAAPLGDIIGSQPYYVGSPNTYHVPQDGDTSYADFRTSHDERTPMVYVGANDGMLHGFNAETGVEELAYIPGLILEAEENYGALAELIDPGYQHRYYVDGSPTVLDVRLDGDWISLLASGLGSGGKGIFALDVTDPDDFSEDNAENIALWEFGPEDDDELDGGEHLGYVYDRPSIVQMENGDHAVVFGNGYFSESGKASLYILPVDAYDEGDEEWDDDEIIRLTPGNNDDGDGDANANSGVNGLSSVSLLDTNSNGRVDLAYAGDLQGNVWRFDLRDESSEEWEDGISLLFSAESDEGVDQVITTGLEVGRNPQGDIMVYFGTGGPEGESTPTTQSHDTFYALKDSNPYESQDIEDAGQCRKDEDEDEDENEDEGENDPDGILSRSDLCERVLKLTRQNVRYFPPGAYDNDIVENGWYVDLPSRERTVSSPLLRGDRIIFTTLIPGIGMCGAEDEGYLYELNAYKGNSFNNPVLDINGDGKVDGNDVINVDGVDVVPVGIKTKGALFTPVVRTDIDKQSETKISSNTAGELITLKERPVNLIPLGRASWRVLE